MEFSPHATRIDELYTTLETSPEGLTNSQAMSRLKKTGVNLLPEKAPPGPTLIFLRQFRSAFVYILFIAALISFTFGKYTDFYVIMAILIINAVMGFVQEYRAERAILALKKLVVKNSKVYRDKKLTQLPSEELVPGDIIYLEAGDSIPADARLVELQNLLTVESALTGESAPIQKELSELPSDAPLADRKNMLWMGTFVASGSARALVTQTGRHTALGAIALSLESIEKEENHFEEKTAVLSRQMGMFAIIGATLTFIVGYFIRGFDLSEISFFTIATLVSAIPEGLPIVLVVVLAIGAHRMAERNVIIRKLSASETLSITNVIMTDKTGTLTQNVMSVEEIILSDHSIVSITGAGWKPEGTFTTDGNVINPLDLPTLKKLITIASQVTAAQLVPETDGRYKIIGDPTEGAQVVLAQKAGVLGEVIGHNQPKIGEYPFDQTLKMRAALIDIRQQQIKELYVSGAPENILERSMYMLDKDGAPIQMTSEHRQRFQTQTLEMTNKAMRTIALAYRPLPAETHVIPTDPFRELIWVGVLGIKDPARPGVNEAIAAARSAGIRVIMATGDHKGTAVAIAEEIGLIGKRDESSTVALTGAELEALSEDEFTEAVQKVSIFARLTPQVKLRIAGELQRLGNTVAMTGDGVNDAPALKKADVGIAMGLVGTDVARESSDLVLTDDNFTSIISAVEEARIIFNNIRRTTYFLITTNFAELATILTTILIGLPLPLLPTQILWLNLVTDGLSVIALATEAGHKHLLSAPPRKRSEQILSADVIPYILLVVLIMTVGTVFVFNALLPYGVEYARTGAFVVMAFTQLFNVFNLRSIKQSVFTLGVLSNRAINWAIAVSVALLLIVIYVPFFQQVFSFKPLDPMTLILLALLSSSVWIITEVYKRFIKH